MICQLGHVQRISARVQHVIADDGSPSVPPPTPTQLYAHGRADKEENYRGELQSDDLISPWHVFQAVFGVCQFLQTVCMLLRLSMFLVIFLILFFMVSMFAICDFQCFHLDHSPVKNMKSAAVDALMIRSRRSGPLVEALAPEEHRGTPP